MSIFKYELLGLKWPETKIQKKQKNIIPHHHSYLNPQSSYVNPQSSILNPRFLFSWV